MRVGQAAWRVLRDPPRARFGARRDGRAEIDIHGTITTEDGKRIALEAGGVAIPEEGSPVFQLREHVSLMSNHPELSWVNRIEVWARGVVDVSTGQVHLRAYAA